MARDSEPVGPRTARLLRSTASRRVSIIPSDASAEPQDATTPWDINTDQQLRQWAHDQPNEIIKMLNELRSQRDTALELNEQWTVVQAEHDKRLDQLEVKQVTIDTLEEANKRYREEVLNLKDKLKEVVPHSADQPRPRQPTEPRVPTEPLPRQSTEDHTRRESSTLSGNDHHKSSKFPDPPVFIGEGEPTWNS